MGYEGKRLQRMAGKTFAKMRKPFAPENSQYKSIVKYHLFPIFGIHKIEYSFFVPLSFTKNSHEDQTISRLHLS